MKFIRDHFTPLSSRHENIENTLECETVPEEVTSNVASAVVEVAEATAPSAPTGCVKSVDTISEVLENRFAIPEFEKPVQIDVRSEQLSEEIANDIPNSEPISHEPDSAPAVENSCEPVSEMVVEDEVGEPAPYTADAVSEELDNPVEPNTDDVANTACEALTAEGDTSVETECVGDEAGAEECETVLEETADLADKYKKDISWEKFIDNVVTPTLSSCVDMLKSFIETSLSEALKENKPELSN